MSTRILDRKLFRDLAHIWSQSLAIAMVMACGVATIILSLGSYQSLLETRDAFYERYRFGSVFASAVRAPDHIKSTIAELQGVASVETRVSEFVLIDMPGVLEPVNGLVISIPDRKEPSVNRLYLRQGRFPDANRKHEISVLENFALAHGLGVGDSFDVTMNDKKRRVVITGIVLSPEFIYSIGPGEMVPDPRRFGVFFMPETTLRGIFDMDGAFNSLSLTTMRDANTREIIDKVDTLLESYGGLGAHDRTDQVSHAFLDAELTQLRAMARIIPPIFLLISAFLVNMILSRLISLEREQVGLLKAIGYSDITVAMHYAKLVILISLVGVVIGVAAGLWLGAGLTKLYGKFYSFPFLLFRQNVDTYILACGVTVFAALVGATKAIVTVTRLPPAVAMQPPAPTTYRSFSRNARAMSSRLSQLTVMSLRHLIRWPVRTCLTILGTSLSVALLITAFFAFGAIDYMIDSIFFKSQRQDATVAFTHDQKPDAIQEVLALPGVMRAEPFRSIPATIRHQHHTERIAIEGVPHGSNLYKVLDNEERYFDLPAEGLVLASTLANKLEVQPGDQVELDLLDQDRKNLKLTVVAIASSYVGLGAYMDLDALNRLTRHGDRISGSRISFDTESLPALYRAVTNSPGIIGITLMGEVLKTFRDTIRENIVTMTTVYIALASIITFGVVYNSARIQLSERARELASLRVFGFTRGEVSAVLLTELSIIVLLAQPVGWLLGYGFAFAVVEGIESDLYRLPMVVDTQTYAIATLIVLISAAVSALIVRRRIDHLDMVEVLKTKE